MIREFLEKIELDDVEKSDDIELAPARLAIYDSPAIPPRVLELSAKGYDEFITLLAAKTYEFSHEKGGKLPFTVIKEVIENLIHAYFKEIVITILDDGNTIRISDQGPGIINKDKAFEPGFSTASKDMKKFIKGVGSGLPIIKESLAILGGVVSVEDNLSQGTVVTIRMQSEEKAPANPPKEKPIKSNTDNTDLSYRHKQLLSLIMELSSTGPSSLAKALDISLSTAYRDLLYLQEHGLVACDNQGKRSLTSRAIEILTNS